MFNVPFYTSNGELTNHQEFQDALLSRREEFCCQENKAYGTGWSTVHTQNDLHKQYPYINKFLKDKTEMFDPDLEVVHCWVNINPKGGFQMRHNHSDCDVAGTYYVSVPKGNSGDLYLYHPSSSVEHLHRIKPYWPFTHCQIPREMDLYFWPGYQDHEVRMNEEEIERWSVSFMMSIPDDIRLNRFPNLPRPK